MHILVIDDNPLLRNALRIVLEASGFTVSEAGDGQEALDRLRGGLSPDVILLDLSMPGMNGWRFRAIQRGDARLIGIPVVVLSGDLLAPEEIDLLAVCHVLRKSAQADSLLTAILRASHCRPCLLARLRASSAAPRCAATAAQPPDSPKAASAAASHSVKSPLARSL